MRRRPASRLAPLLGAGLALLACGGEDAAGPPAPDAAPPSACGPGVGRVEVGADHPFVPLAEPRYPVRAGFQGGYHIDVSVRARGALDADHTDVDLKLYDGDRLLASHVSSEAWLSIAADEPACDYDNAQLVLLDAEGGLLQGPDVLAVTGRPLTLRVALTSGAGDARGEFVVVLDPPG